MGNRNYLKINNINIHGLYSQLFCTVKKICFKFELSLSNVEIDDYLKVLLLEG